MGNSDHKVSRRRFLGQASCAAVGSTTLFSTLFNLKSLNAAASFNSSIGSNPNDYKAIVCLLNAGGLDSFNMIIPKGNPEYGQYAATRSNMAVPQNEILPINPLVSDGKQYGLHPSLVHMQSLFETNKLAFVSNIGSLVQPLTRQQFYDGSVPIPLGLYSHSDQIMHWQTGVPNARVAQGWGGKMADLMVSANQNQTVSMNISLSGSNVFQTGNNSVEYSLHPEYGSIGINGYQEGDWLINELRTSAIDGMVNPTYQNVFKNTYVKTIKTAIDGNEMLSTVLDNAPAFIVPFSNTNLSDSFQMIARTISGREQLNMNRQIFFIEYGGWDHHDSLLMKQSEMFTEVDNALHEFNAAMEQLGLLDKVTTFSLSEFSRTLTSNGNGTDHAWGGNVFVMGGAVYGKKIYGTFPSLGLGSSNPQEIGGGSLIPTTAADQYFAEIAMWYGVPVSELATLFPNIGYFFDTTSGSSPLGFLNLS